MAITGVVPEVPGDPSIPLFEGVPTEFEQHLYGTPLQLQLGALLAKRKLRLAELWKEMDRDGSGDVQKGEFCAVMLGLGLQAESRREVDALFDSLDADGSGHIEVREVKPMLTRLHEAATLAAQAEKDAKVAKVKYEVSVRRAARREATLAAIARAKAAALAEARSTTVHEAAVATRVRCVAEAAEALEVLRVATAAYEAAVAEDAEANALAYFEPIRWVST